MLHQWDPEGKNFVFNNQLNKKNLVDFNLEDKAVLSRGVLFGHRIRIS